MGRRCIVPGCLSTDLTTLVHRFPRKHCKEWQTSLQLNAFSIEDLLDKYVVCAHHFRINDYRHRESKHLNTTAIPTLDVVPEAEKIRELQIINPIANKRRIVISTSKNFDTDCITPYANNVLLKTLLPLNVVNDRETSMVHNLHSDDDLIEEKTVVDTEMMLEDCSALKAFPNNKLMEFVLDDENCVEDPWFVVETDSNCDSKVKTITDDRLTDYVELIETKEETDDECFERSSEQTNANQNPSEWTEMYANLSRNELIEQLVAATSRIKELETKLNNIQKAHLSVIQNLNNLNKVLIS